jgi:hypothetical protein
VIGVTLLGLTPTDSKGCIADWSRVVARRIPELRVIAGDYLGLLGVPLILVF